MIDITGTDLGVQLSDFNYPHGITINNARCVPVNESYVPGEYIQCVTGGTEAGRYQLRIKLIRDPTPATVFSDFFEVVGATVISVVPTFGPIAGGSVLTILGSNLDIGNSLTVSINRTLGPECDLL